MVGAVDQLKQAGSRLLDATEPRVPPHIHLLLPSLYFCLFVALWALHKLRKSISKRRRTLGTIASKNRFAHTVQAARRTRFATPIINLSYGTFSFETTNTISSAPIARSRLFGNRFFPPDEMSPLTNPHYRSHYGSLSHESGRSLEAIWFIISLRVRSAFDRAIESLQDTLLRFESWLVYQPAKIGLFKARLPSNGTSLAVVAIYAFVLFFLMLGLPFVPEYPLLLAARAGPLIMLFLPPLYIFAAKNQPLKYFTGYSYEDLNIFHRRLGEIIVGLAVLHGVSKFLPWYRSLRNMDFDSLELATLQIIVAGIALLVAYTCQFFTSLTAFREMQYAFFIRLHSSIQVVALALLVIHAPQSWPCVTIAFTIFFVDRVIYRTWMTTENVIARVRILPDKHTVELKIDKESNGMQTCKFLKRFFTQSFEGDWLPTSHFYIRIPGLTKHGNEAHPYFIACVAPSEHSYSSLVDLKVIVPACGPFSKELLSIARRPYLYVDIDGPYGSNYALEMLSDRDTCILVAGRAGIAGLWPLAWSLIDHQKMSDIETGLFQPRQNVILIWAYRHAFEIYWVGGLEEINSLRRYGISVLLAGPTESASMRLDMEDQIDYWIRKHDPLGNLRTGIVCCSSYKMQRAVRNKAAAEIRKGRKVAYHEMSFKL